MLVPWKKGYDKLSILKSRDISLPIKVCIVKSTALTIWTFVGKVMSLLLNVLSRFVIAFLPRKKISWLQSPSAVILEPKKKKFVIASTFFPFYLS